MSTPKKTDKNTPPQKFEVEQGADNNNIPTEDAVMADNESNEHAIEQKGIHLYIDPSGEKTTGIDFILNDQAITLETIEKKIAEADAVTINGFLDKANYEKVKKLKSEFLKTRTTLNKVAKADVIDPINAWVKNYKVQLDVVSAKLQEGQDKMDDKLTEIDDAFKLEEERIEREATARIQGRVSGLLNLGATFNEAEGFYTFPYNEALIINSVQLKDWEEEEYQAFIDEVVEAWNADQTIKLEEEEKAAVEAARIKGLADQTLKLRHKVLRLLGAVETNGTWTVPGGDIFDDKFFAELEEEEWDQFVDEIENPVVEEQVNDIPIDTPPDHTVEYKGQVGDSPAISRVHESAHSTSGFDIEGVSDTHDFEEVNADPELVDEYLDLGYSFNHNFTKEDPFINHHFKSTTMRIFPTMYEMEANDGVAPSELMDAGILGRTELQYILIKRPK